MKQIMNNIKLDRKQKIIFMVIFLNLAIIFVYGPVHQYEFVNYDDNIYVIDNINVCRGLTWKNVWWALTATEAGFWHPLTWMSLMGDHELYLMNAGGYHGTNVILHAISATLLFFVFYRMTGGIWQSGLVAALFALHPLNVEPVAWIASRKDVLSTLFWMLTLWLYFKYTEKPGYVRYFLVLTAFIMGLMSKPMVVTLPFALLLIDYWPLGRFRKIPFSRLVIEKAPLIILAFIVAIVTFITEQEMGALISVESFPLDVRIFNAAKSYTAYIAKTLYPMNLTVFYPHPGYWSLWQVLVSFAFLLTVSFTVIKLRRSFPYLFVGWFWYLGSLIPVIGLIQIGSHSMADRYAYVPLIGLFIMLGWGVADLAKKWRFNACILSVAAVMVIIFMASTATMQVRHWENSITLFKHSISVTAENPIAFYNLGIAYRQKGDLTAAIENFKKAAQLSPDLAHIQNNLGVALIEKGDFPNALNAFGKVIELQPGHAGAHNNIAMILYRQNKFEAAREHFLAAVKLRPDYANAHYHLALILGQQGLKEDALNHYRQAIQINPAYGIAQYQSVLFDKFKDKSVNSASHP